MVVLSGAFLGLLFNASPGPINVECIRRGLQGGFWDALGVQLGGMVGQIVYALLALAGVGLLFRSAAVHTLLGLAGAGFLLYLGATAVHRGWRGRHAAASAQAGGVELAGGGERAVRGGMRLGAAISLASPWGIAFWLSVGGTALPRTPGGAAGFLGGFVVGGLLWALGFPVLVGWIRSRRAQAIAGLSNVVSIGCGIALIAFGLALAYSVIGPSTGGHDLARRASGPAVERSGAPHRASISVTDIAGGAPAAPTLRGETTMWTRSGADITTEDNTMTTHLHGSPATTQFRPSAGRPLSPHRGSRAWSRLASLLQTTRDWILAEPVSAPGATTPFLGAPARRWPGLARPRAVPSSSRRSGSTPAHSPLPWPVSAPPDALREPRATRPSACVDGSNRYRSDHNC
jgi:threonine/homoserine/homoserine lactone efflux protein